MSETRHAEVPDTGEGDTGRMPARQGVVASFARFVVCGGGVSLVASSVVPAVAEVMPWAVANALITVVSTLLCTELHSLVTFRTGRLAGLRRHLQSAGSAAASYALTTVAVLVLHTVQPTADRLLEQAVYLCAAGLAGIGRFLVLRLFVFAGSRDRNKPEPADRMHHVKATRNAVPERFRRVARRIAGARPLPGPRRLGPVLVGCGTALVVRAWLGLDPLQALGLAATGVLLLRRDPRRCLTAAVTAVLLVVDAWLDVLTSLPGTELATALATALGTELPLAALCVALAVCSLPHRVRGPGPDSLA